MAHGQTGILELLNDKVNEKRSNMIGALSNLYKKFEKSASGPQTHSFEKYTIVFSNGILEVHGCIDEVKVAGTKYSDVFLGSKITSYGQIPYHWMESYIGQSCV